MIAAKGYNDFSLSNPSMMLIIFLAGPMTVIPLFLLLQLKVTVLERVLMLW
jgi:chloramphenicol-sensitive protein RarD